MKGLNENFLNGLVFGFDLGTGSIGYSVRRKTEWIDVGVILCSENTNNLKDRNKNRRMRRTLRSRKQRLLRLKTKLISIGLPSPQNFIDDPVKLRLKAVKGEEVSPEELHCAIFHLLRRRGYQDVPWKSSDKDKEAGEIRDKVNALSNELKERGFRFPCEWLAAVSHNQRRREQHWERNLIIDEFNEIVEKQKERYPNLFEKRDEILYGDTHRYEKNGKQFSVFFKSTESKDSGVFSMHWPRFDNRSPSLDIWKPIDDEGRLLHVARTNNNTYKEFQFEASIINFRVLNSKTRIKIENTPPELIEMIREIWLKPRGKKEGSGMKVSISDLKKIIEKWNKTHPDTELSLIEGQTDLTPISDKGRARYSTPTLRSIRDTLQGGDRVNPPQPILKRKNESTTDAVNRMIAEIPNPLVSDRLSKLLKLLNGLVSKFGKPDLVIVEAVRDIGLGKKNKKKLIKIRDERAKERVDAREDGASSKKEIQRYLLFKELDGVCPYCRRVKISSDILNSDFEVEHIVPYRRSFCNEIFNLTLACRKCNKEKGNRTPYEAWHNTERWIEIEESAKHFSEKGKRLKADLLISPNAEELVESRRALAETSYIARSARGLILTRLEMLTDEGRDPSDQKGYVPYAVTSGALTSGLRHNWGLNAALNFDEPDPDKKLLKNRGDARHHALDAMVIASTLPWAANSSKEKGGWRNIDEFGNELIENPIELTLKTAREQMKKIIPENWDPVGYNSKHYKTTLLSMKKVINDKRETEEWFVSRELLSSLRPKDTKKIYPKELGTYISTAWKFFEKEGGKTGKGDLFPKEFVDSLCFSHFQRWRSKGMPEFSWPEKIKIPIKTVRYFSVKDPDAVLPLKRNADNGPFVKREDFREAWILLKEDGTFDKVIHVPHYRKDPLYPKMKRPNSAIVIQKGQNVILKSSPYPNSPAGAWRVMIIGKIIVKLIPAVLAQNFKSKDEESKTYKLFGMPESGWKATWNNFFKHLELSNYIKSPSE